jgi:hypothetical protein
MTAIQVLIYGIADLPGNELGNATAEQYSPPPASLLPADHRWCFANDVDPHWPGIGAEQDAIVDDLELDVVRAEPTRYHRRIADRVVPARFPGLDYETRRVLDYEASATRGLRSQADSV